MKVKAKEIFLLVLPVLFLIGPGFLLREPGPPLKVEKMTVVHLPNSSPDFHAPGIRTKAVLTVRYNNSSPYKHYITGLHAYEITGNGYLEDQRGKKYINYRIKNATTAGDAFMSGTRPIVEEYIGRQRYAISFPVPLSHVPKTAGKVTLKAKLTLNHRWSLPVSVVVRE
jgi:hypothetical protein